MRFAAYFLATVLMLTALSAQESQRRIVNSVQPVYPDLARQVHVEGNVKLEVVVGPDGRVKKMNVLGGSPLLVQAAQDAIQKWRWESKSEQTIESVQVNFHTAGQ